MSNKNHRKKKFQTDLKWKSKVHNTKELEESLARHKNAKKAPLSDGRARVRENTASRNSAPKEKARLKNNQMRIRDWLLKRLFCVRERARSSSRMTHSCFLFANWQMDSATAEMVDWYRQAIISSSSSSDFGQKEPRLDWVMVQNLNTRHHAQRRAGGLKMKFHFSFTNWAAINGSIGTGWFGGVNLDQCETLNPRGSKFDQRRLSAWFLEWYAIFVPFYLRWCVKALLSLVILVKALEHCKMASKRTVKVPLGFNWMD